MWNSIIIVIAVILILFLYDVAKENRKIRNSGGINVKYAVIMSLFLSEGKWQILNVTKREITLGLKQGVVDANIILSHDFGKLTINYITQSPFLGKQKKEWTFHEEFNQFDMYKIIISELEAKYKN